MRQIDSTTFVSGQIRPSDIPALAAKGVTMIVNNRPDGEEPGQPASAEIEAAARAAGIAYRHIPIAGGFNADDVIGMVQALDEADGPALAFCRSGTRSTYLWAMARSEQGEPADELAAKAASAGYDLAPIRAYLG